jgi:hypothetical protein
MYFRSMKAGILVLLFAALSTFSLSQFPGPAGTLGSTAIHKDSSVFMNWANAAQLDLGLVDIANPFSGLAASGDANSPTGVADGTVVSLGDSGIAILTFPQPITNGQGPDFAIFENGFSDNFLELAFVEVSSDGVNFYRFPATSNTQTETQIGPFDALGEATLLNNLAGKYRANFGTPFDLQELDGVFGLNIMAITHVKIVDVVGMVSGNHVQTDSNGNPINDPYPTAFAQGGFDLDAVGVIHQGPVGLSEECEGECEVWRVYPNPAVSGGTITVSSNVEVKELTLLSSSGEVLAKNSSNFISLSTQTAGIYLLKMETDNSTYMRKVIIF